MIFSIRTIVIDELMLNITSKMKYNRAIPKMIFNITNFRLNIIEYFFIIYTNNTIIKDVVMSIYELAFSLKDKSLKFINDIPMTKKLIIIRYNTLPCIMLMFKFVYQ